MRTIKLDGLTWKWSVWHRRTGETRVSLQGRAWTQRGAHRKANKALLALVEAFRDSRES